MLGMLDSAQPDWMLQKVDAPVIVINGRSPWWDARYEHYVRSLSPRLDYEVMEGAGHFLMLEKPAEFNTALTAKLRKYDLIAQ
jgi:pimeloyl-ACP methyl ester carboxylesterase